MARQNAPLVVFNRGRISKLGLARVDIDRTRLSADIQTNMMPRTLGSMMLRPGLQYIGTISNSSTAILMPFVFSNRDTALLEFTSTTMRAWVNDVIVTRTSSTAVVTNGTFDSDLTSWTDADESGSTSEWLTGGYMSLIGTRYARAIRRQTIVSTSTATTHGLKVVVNRGRPTLKVGSSSEGDDYFSEAVLRPGSYSLGIASTGNFFIELSANTEYRTLVDSLAIESSGPMVVDSAWVSSDLSLVRWAQSADVIFTTAAGYKQKRIERYSTDSWAIVDYDPQDGPFRGPNVTNKRLEPSALSGDITLACDQPLFNSGHVGALFKITSVGQSVAVTLSGADQWSDPIRVSGIDTSRVFDILITTGSTYDVTVRAQRSVGEVGSWVNISGLSWTTTQDTTHDDGLDNQIIFYRIGVDSLYVSGTPTATLTYAAGGLTGVARINTVTGTTESSASVLTHLGSTQQTETWEEGSWSSFRGWPSAVVIHEGRIWQAGKSNIWGSISDAYESFDPSVEGDSGPINRTIGSGPIDNIEWLVSLGRLIIGTDGREIQAKTSSLEEPLTPSNFGLRDISTQGSDGVQAVAIDKRALFTQKAGIRVMEIGYAGETLDYETADRTVLVPEIGEPTIVRMAVQRQPDTRVHCVRSSTDGTVALFVSDPAENVSAWLDIETGDADGFNGRVEDVAVLPSAGEDAVYYAVRREINGSTMLYLERWAQEWDARGDGGRASARFTVISGSSSTGNQITSVTADGVEILDASLDWAVSNENFASLICNTIDDSIPWPPTSHDNSTLDISGQTLVAIGLDFKSDGTKMYVVAFGAPQIIYQYSLVTPWDATTATYDAVFFDMSGFGYHVSSIFYIRFGADGTRLYVSVASPTTDTVEEFTVSTPWDLGTVVPSAKSLDVSSEDTGPSGIDFKDDGTKMYINGFQNEKIFQYSLTTAWDINTATYNNVSVDMPADSSVPRGLKFSSDGTKMFFMINATKTIVRYGLTTPWELSTASNDNSSFSVVDDMSSPQSFYINDIGLYVVDFVDNTVVQYLFGAKDYDCNLLLTIGSTESATFDIFASAFGSTANGEEIIIATSGDVNIKPTVSTLSGGYSIGGVAGITARNRIADSHITQDTAIPTVTVSGIDHLVGSSVVAWADGKDFGSYTVSSTGTITLAQEATSAMVGLKYNGWYKSAKLAYAAEAGTALIQRKKVNHLGFVLADTHSKGLEFGPSTANLDPLPRLEKGALISSDTIYQSYDEPSISFPGNWDTDSRIVLKATAPRPVTVLGAVVQIDTKEKI